MTPEKIAELKRLLRYPGVWSNDQEQYIRSALPLLLAERDRLREVLRQMAIPEDARSALSPEGGGE